MLYPFGKSIKRDTPPTLPTGYGAVVFYSVDVIKKDDF